MLANITSKITRPVNGGYTPDIEDSGRRRLFSVFIILLSLPLIVFGAELIKRHLFLLAFVNYLVVTMFFGFIIIMRRSASAKALYRIVLGMLSILVLYWVNRGAIKGYASIWILTLPPFAFYLLGRREGLIWTIIISLLTSVQFLFPAISLYGYTYDPVYVSRHLAALLLIILFTYNYELMRERYKKAMEMERSRLNEEKERLAQAKSEADDFNRKLNDEMKIRQRAEEDLIAHRDHLEEIVGKRTLELKNINERLASGELKYRLMADNITDMIWTADLELNFTFVSPSVTRIFGYTVDEAMALPFDRWNTPESFSRVLLVFSEQMEIERSGKADPDRYVNIELEHIKKDGTVVPVEVTVSFLRDAGGEAIGIVGITRDISERVRSLEENRKMQEQLAQAQKMEAIGTLVGGIAHDFNNILGGIIGSFDLLARMLKDETLEKRERIDKYLNLGMESSLRSAGLIKQLLALSRKHEISLSPVDINDSVSHVIEICRNSLPKNVEIEYTISEVPLVVLGDTVQIEQVLLNLCINASHAMTIMRPEREKQGGILKVKSYEVKSDYIMKELHPESAPYEGTWAKIEVSDTGIGMDDETRKRMFEPFFSMKKKDEGSGLGLAISYNIIRQHKGIIHVYSEQGRGSCFTVYIPTYNNVAGIEHTRRGSGDITMGNGTVLVIDDEPVMLNIAKGVLEECGYNVITAESGEEGIGIYRERYSDISAVLVDLSMPGKSGLEVYMELRTINREVKALLASGMLDTQSQATADRIGINGTVHKPYLADELSLKIKSVMQQI